ncbi:GNAT family N-acetyltransferase [Clostridium taeniosporum]|uniref:GNAT family N-acetyltransferase n=1 Tax=Clostridium taeniosporum TaxID=394958 RepID=A0A1D7XJQ4_9CLOT|nr:GNAT family N-acetyltransferase [Clostridium taeniosporum]AOR23420.1 GNAT family N-acetyltransferase [Clostridium taeniosporum]
MLEIRDYKKNDEKYIIDLFKKSFYREMKPYEWRWNYENNICKDKFIKLMWDDKTLAGHYAILPNKMKIYDKFYCTGLSMTTMTSPKYKKQGIFVKLASNLYEEIYNKIPIIYGFPNNNSLHGFKKYLGWEHVLDIEMYSCYSYKFDLKSLDKNIKSTEMLDDRVNILFDKFSKRFKEYKIMIKRDKKYLNWRYNLNPYNKYYYLVYEKDNEYLGYCIYKIFKYGDKKVCDLVDIISVDNMIYEKILETLIDLMACNGIRNINSWFVNKDKLQIGEKLGFKKNNIITHFGFKLNCDFLDSDMMNIEKWYLTMGDSDVF